MGWHDVRKNSREQLFLALGNTLSKTLQSARGGANLLSVVCTTALLAAGLQLS